MKRNSYYKNIDGKVIKLYTHDNIIKPPEESSCYDRNKSGYTSLGINKDKVMHYSRDNRTGK